MEEGRGGFGLRFPSKGGARGKNNLSFMRIRIQFK